MDQLVTGNTLLVGEGDFSFAVALATTLIQKGSIPHLIATSFETEDTIDKHIDAREHIQWLRENGVTVYLQTDATCLHNNPILKDGRFSLILFNFPHSGGKSNHKRNRKLLDDFFRSATHVLSEKGQILVTLCRGQGGTPADKPMRAWHDSWQVVSMAANSSLILVDTLPFNREDYVVYSSTGFRSQDKGFNTENAVTHIFEVTEAVSVPEQLTDGVINWCGHRFRCSRFYFQKLNQLRKLGKCHNLIVHVSQSLQTAFEKLAAASHCTVSCKKVEWPEEVECEDSSVTKQGRELILPSAYIVKNNQLREAETCVCLQLIEQPSSSCGTGDSNTSKQETDVFYLRHSLLEEMELSHCQETGIHLEHGPVFRLSCFEENVYPVKYQLAGIWLSSKSAVRSSESYTSSDSETTGCHGDGTKGQNLQEVYSKCIQMTNTLHDECVTKIWPNKSLRFESLESSNCPEKNNCLFLGKIVMETSGKQAICKPKDDKSNQTDSAVVGHIYTDSSVFLKGAHQNESNVSLKFVINVDQLIMSGYDINDIRLLWTGKTDILSKLSELPTTSVKTSTLPFKPPSLYPMTYTHDMSFWENQEIDFNEQKFYNLVGDVAEDTVKLVTLLDKYKDTSTGRVSRCYRLIFQSCDKALSYNCSWKLQSLIRLHVQDVMSIILR